MSSVWTRIRVGVASAALAAALTTSVSAQDVIRIGGVANYGPVIPVLVGEAIGTFKKAGVDMKFTGFAGGSAAMEGLAAGEVDLVNFFPPGVALAKARGVKGTIVSASTLTPRGWWIMVKKDSPINDVKGLASKKIGITSNGSTTDFFALWAGQQAGGTVTRVPVGGGGLIPGLISGNVDAIIAFPPLSYRATLSGDGKTVVDLGQAMGNNLPDVWVASDKMIAEKPEVLRKGLVGLYSAIVHMKANPDWTIKFLVEKAKLEEAVARQEFENTVKGLSEDGAIKEEWVAASLALGTLAGIKDLPAPKTLYTDKFVPVTTIKP